MENPRIEVIKVRLAELERERASLLKEMEDLSAVRLSPDALGVPASDRPLSTPEEHIALFMRLFLCREDVFPKMWENQKKGTRGYSPACASEWIRGVCDKPRMKCSACQNRAFVLFDETIARGHLEGTFTVGSYTIREDDTCIFLAADFDKDRWGVDALTYKAAARDMGVEVTSNDRDRGAAVMPGYSSRSRSRRASPDSWERSSSPTPWTGDTISGLKVMTDSSPARILCRAGASETSSPSPSRESPGDQATAYLSMTISSPILTNGNS